MGLALGCIIMIAGVAWEGVLLMLAGFIGFCIATGVTICKAKKDTSKPFPKKKIILLVLSTIFCFIILLLAVIMAWVSTDMLLGAFDSWVY